MKIIKVAGVLFIAVGILGLVYGGFDYTKSSHEAKLGPIEFAIKKQEHVNVPMWAGVSAIVLGGILLLLPAGTKKR